MEITPESGYIINVYFFVKNYGRTVPTQLCVFFFVKSQKSQL